MRFLTCKSLKTKGLSPKTEAFSVIGGGENRTLVLSIRHTDHYMLSVLSTDSHQDAERIGVSLQVLIREVKGTWAQALTSAPRKLQWIIRVLVPLKPPGNLNC